MSVRETVNAWFGERIATGAIARNTDAYNQAVAALPDLIARLEAEPPVLAAFAGKPAKKAAAAKKVTPAKPANVSAPAAPITETPPASAGDGPTIA